MKKSIAPASDAGRPRQRRGRKENSFLAFRRIPGAERRVLLIGLLLIALSAVATAEAAPTRPRMGRGVGLRGLELSEAQREKIAELRTALNKETEQLRADLKARQTELGTLWQAEKLEAAKIVAQVRELSELRAKLAVARAEHRLATLGLLTAEQRAQLRESARERGRKGRGMMRGRGMGRGEGRQHECQDDCDNCSGHDKPGKK